MSVCSPLQGGYPSQVQGGTPSQVWLGGYPISSLGAVTQGTSLTRSGWGTPPALGWGIPLDLGQGTPPDLGWGTPPRPWMGYPPDLGQGNPPMIVSTWYVAGGMPLAFMQEDFLVTARHPKDGGRLYFQSVHTYGGGGTTSQVWVGGYPISGLSRGYPISGLGREVPHPRSR